MSDYEHDRMTKCPHCGEMVAVGRFRTEAGGWFSGRFDSISLGTEHLCDGASRVKASRGKATCRRCGADGLYWVFVGGKFRLRGKDTMDHICPRGRPARDIVSEMPELFGEYF